MLNVEPGRKDANATMAMAGVGVLDTGSGNFTYKRDKVSNMLVFRTALFQTITQRRVVIIYGRFGGNLSGSIFEGRQIQDFWAHDFYLEIFDWLRNC